jgi:quercetin dioxygenase-like cupin family protein
MGMGGRLVRLGQMELRFVVDEDTPGASAVVFEWRIPSRARVPVPHYHAAVDEVVYGLEGRLDSIVAGVRHAVGPGDTVFVPRGQVHHHENPHDGLARVLVVLTPTGIGRRYFEEIAALVNAGGPPDPARMKEIMLRHGLVPA